MTQRQLTRQLTDSLVLRAAQKGARFASSIARETKLTTRVVLGSLLRLQARGLVSWIAYAAEGGA